MLNANFSQNDKTVVAKTTNGMIAFVYLPLNGLTMVRSSGCFAKSAHDHPKGFSGYVAEKKEAEKIALQKIENKQWAVA